MSNSTKDARFYQSLLEEALVEILLTFSVDRLKRLRHSLCWTEDVDGEDLQFEIQVLEVKSDCILVGADLTRCYISGDLKEPISENQIVTLSYNATETIQLNQN